MSLILRPSFSVLMRCSLLVILPLFLCGFVLFYDLYYGVNVVDMLQGWRIFLSPSLLPSCLLAAFLLAFILACLLRFYLSCEVDDVGIYQMQKKPVLLHWRDVDKIEQKKFLFVNVAYVFLKNGGFYCLNAKLFDIGLIDARGHVKTEHIVLILARARSYKKHF
ncbi:MAG: hypothetical protein HRU20_05600 [Pseudomonadales bacterium]|nr:hypothetical protein [Pseudomonadales bacterium]